MPQNIWSDGTVEVIGTVTKEPEIKKVGEKQTLIVNFHLAISRWKEENKSYCSCSVFGKMANFAIDIKKGDIIHAIGKYEPRKYTDKNGIEQTQKNLSCDFISIMGNNTKIHKNNFIEENNNLKNNNENTISKNESEEIISILGDSNDLPF